jgi:hypothetical protein
MNDEDRKALLTLVSEGPLPPKQSWVQYPQEDLTPEEVKQLQAYAQEAHRTLYLAHKVLQQVALQDFAKTYFPPNP